MLKGKVAWITGGGSGLGLAAAADIEKRHGRIDILVTSAGTNLGGLEK